MSDLAAVWMDTPEGERAQADTGLRQSNGTPSRCMTRPGAVVQACSMQKPVSNPASKFSNR